MQQGPRVAFEGLVMLLVIYVCNILKDHTLLIGVLFVSYISIKRCGVFVFF